MLSSLLRTGPWVVVAGIAWAGVSLAQPDEQPRRLVSDRQESATTDSLLEDEPREPSGSLLAPSDSSLGGGEAAPTDSLLTSPHAGAASDDPLAGLGPAEQGDTRDGRPPVPDPHQALWLENRYPSAESCRECHPKHYEQWRASGHAYAGISPMFHRFEQSMAELTRGTSGHFCVRCHLPVGTQLNQPRSASVLDAPKVVREGVTCIACHRVREPYWRTHGDRRIEPGDIHAPVSSGGDGAGVARAISQAQQLKLKLAPDEKGPGQAMHRGTFFFEPLKNGDVCVSCHQVAVHPGIWLEVVHAQYRSGPAADKGITCQQCHMGAVPGKPSGYQYGHIAEIHGKPFGEPQKQSNHTFWGPGYSIAHPGIFPHHPDADRFTPRQWLAFDYRAGWGTDAFERSVGPDAPFPEPWQHVDDRIDARRIIDENLAKIDQKRASAAMTLEAAIDVSEPIFYTEPRAGRPLAVGFRVTNTSEGHNLPTGSLGAQPQLWLNVALIDPRGRRVWESGYLDSRGDLADMHSVDVARGHVRRDKDLFNLQTKFLINNVHGTDREAALPLNFSLDQLVLLRPGAQPISVLNHPPLIRMESHSIPPLDHRTPRYHVPAEALRRPGQYRLSVRMRSRTEPIYFMRQINSTPAMIRRMNENMLDVQRASHTFRVR